MQEVCVTVWQSWCYTLNAGEDCVWFRKGHKRETMSPSAGWEREKHGSRQRLNCDSQWELQTGSEWRPFKHVLPEHICSQSGVHTVNLLCSVHTWMDYDTTKPPQPMQPCCLWSFCLLVMIFLVVFRLFGNSLLPLCVSLWLFCIIAVTLRTLHISSGFVSLGYFGEAASRWDVEVGDIKSWYLDRHTSHFLWTQTEQRPSEWLQPTGSCVMWMALQRVRVRDFSFLYSDKFIQLLSSGKVLYLQFSIKHQRSWDDV